MPWILDDVIITYDKQGYYNNFVVLFLSERKQFIPIYI